MHLIDLVVVTSPQMPHQILLLLDPVVFPFHKFMKMSQTQETNMVLEMDMSKIYDPKWPHRCDI